MSKNKKPQIYSREQAGVVLQEHHSFSGPIPHPDVLARFDSVVPGAAERIIKMAETQSEHRKDLEKKVIESDIARSRMGQILGFVIAVVGLIVSAVVSVYGNAITGGIIGAGTLASLVGVFMYGTTVRSKERVEKEKTI